MPIPSDIIQEIHVNEKRIKELRNNPREHHEEIKELATSVRKSYRELIVYFPTFTSDKVKDPVSMLWKSCFYKTIEEFRVNIKQRKKAFELQKSAPGMLATRVKDQLALLTQEFQRFLHDSSRFFLKLMQELEGVAGRARADSKVDVYNAVLGHMYGCLLYLGDLARYQILYAENKSDYSDSVHFYERAALIMPASGNAQNQLAMLATYNEAESTAVFHYCRSVLAKMPFSGGLQNLAKLYSINVESFRSLQRQYRGDHNSRFKYFLTSFVRLNGLLFGWTINMHRDYIVLTGGDEPSTQSSVALGNDSIAVNQLHDMLSSSVFKTSSKYVNEVEFSELLEEVMRDLDLLINTPKLTDLHLLRLVAICIFSVHFAESPERCGIEGNDSGNSFLSSFSSVEDSQPQADYSEAEEVEYRTKVQSLALSMLFKLISRVAAKWTENISSAEKNRRTFNNKMLLMLSTFTDWAGHHTVYLTSQDAETMPAVSLSVPSTFVEDVVKPSVFGDDVRPVSSVPETSTQSKAFPMSEEKWRALYRVDRDFTRSEARSRSTMKSSLSMMKEHLMKSLSAHGKGGEDILSTVQPGMILREHAELRGYLPILHCCERLFESFDPLQKNLIWVPESMARIHREYNILRFIKDNLERREVNTSSRLDRDEAVTVPRRGLLDVSLTPQGKDKVQRDFTKIGKGEKKAKGKHTKEKAKEREREIKTSISENDVLNSDFPALPGSKVEQKDSGSESRAKYSQVVESGPSVSTTSPVGEELEHESKPFSLWYTYTNLPADDVVENAPRSDSVESGFDPSQWPVTPASVFEGFFSEGLPADKTSTGHEEDYFDELLDDEVVFKPAFARLPETPHSPLVPTSDLRSSTSNHDILGMRTSYSLSPHPSKASTSSPSAVRPASETSNSFFPEQQRSNADILASLGLHSGNGTPMEQGGVLGKLGLPSNEIPSAPLFGSSWSEGVLGGTSSLGLINPLPGTSVTSSLFTSNLDWDPLRLSSKTAGLPSAPPATPPGFSAPPGMGPPQPPSISQGQETTSPLMAAAPPGLRGPPKQAYLGNGAWHR
eukprot:scaffold1389_cov251-Ochromonas_danica.AAC.40